MASIFERHGLPDHLFNIPELDFHEDLFADRLGGLWFRLGAWTIQPYRDVQGVENRIERQSIMLPPGQFSEIYGKFESIGNLIHNLGKPTKVLRSYGKEEAYYYAPFYRFDLGLTSVSCEPLVFLRFLTSSVELYVNPDLELYFELEEKPSGIWWDPSRGSEILRRRVIENGNLYVVEIRTDYLQKYLQARQLSLVVAHYRHLHLFDPSPETLEAFVEGNLEQGSPDQGAKAVFQNWGLRQDTLGSPFLQRRLHLWFEIKPPEINIDDPWADEPPFDPYEFTLPTQEGSVAPARWTHFRQVEGRRFEGESGNFLDMVYFRQEVLSKYEGASGFEISDTGSVEYRHYWGLVRGTSRIGNELISTAIGDFAEGVPFEEWQHWKQHAVEPPSPETISTLCEEQTVPDAVNCLVEQLNVLNEMLANLANVIGAEVSDPFWNGSVESLAGRQLKWVYPTTADDDEFLKRATLMSTLVIDGLIPPSLRGFLQTWGDDLHLDGQGQSLGSRKLLERVTLIAVLIEELQPTSAEIPILVKQAEGCASSVADPDLQAELKKLCDSIRDELVPLASLYDLRVHAGIAHSPNKEKVIMAMKKLDLPEKNWHRTHYLCLLNLVTQSVRQVVDYLVGAAENVFRY